MTTGTESRRYQVTADLAPMQWGNWEIAMAEWGFEVVRLDPAGVLKGIYAGRDDFARFAGELLIPSSKGIDERTWNGIGRIVRGSEMGAGQSFIGTGDVVRPNNTNYQRDTLYSIELLDRLSRGKRNVKLQRGTPGIGVKCATFLSGIVGQAGENPDLFAESSRKAAETLQAQVSDVLNPVV